MTRDFDRDPHNIVAEKGLSFALYCSEALHDMKPSLEVGSAGRATNIVCTGLPATHWKEDPLVARTSTWSPSTIFTNTLDASLPPELCANPTFDYSAHTAGIARVDAGLQSGAYPKSAPSSGCDVLLSNPMFEHLSALSTPRSSMESQRPVSDCVPAGLQEPPHHSNPLHGVIMHDNITASPHPLLHFSPPQYNLADSDAVTRESLAAVSGHSSALEGGSEFDLKINAYHATAHKAKDPFSTEHSFEDSALSSPMAGALSAKLRSISGDLAQPCAGHRATFPARHSPGVQWEKEDDGTLRLTCELAGFGETYGARPGGGSLTAGGVERSEKTSLAFQAASRSFQAQRLTVAQVFAQSMQELSVPARSGDAAANGWTQKEQAADTQRRQKKSVLTKVHAFVSGKALRKAECA